MKSKNEIIGFGQKPQIEVFQKATKEFKQSPEFSYEKIKNGICSAYVSCGEECPEMLIESLMKNLLSIKMLSNIVIN